LDSHYWATWLPDGKRILFESNEAGHERRTWIQDVAGNPARPITPEGTRGRWASPDGRFLVAFDPENKCWLYPIDGGAPTALREIRDGERPIRWSEDGRYLFVLNGSLPAQIFRLDLAIGRRKLLRKIFLPDAAGVTSVSSALVTPDGASYVYSYSRFLSDLYAVKRLM
jgi:Tol biopolymer transport system component